SAMFWHESAVEFFPHAEAVESCHAEGQERLADMKAREFLALQNDDAPSRSRQQRRRGAAGRATADNRHIVHLAAHSAIKVAKFPGKQNTANQSDEVDSRSGRETVFRAD